MHNNPPTEEKKENQELVTAQKRAPKYNPDSHQNLLKIFQEHVDKPGPSRRIYSKGNLVKTPEQIKPFPITTETISLNPSLQHIVSGIVIEDLKTKEVFLSPKTNQLSPVFSPKKYNFENYLKGLSPFTTYDQTIKIKDSELLKHLLTKNIDFSQQRENYTIPITENQIGQSTSGTKPLILHDNQNTKYTQALLKRSLKFNPNYHTSSDSSDNENSNDNWDNNSNSDSIHNSNTENSSLENEMAAFKISHLLTAIPTYDGKEKDLESFINVCQNFYDFMDTSQRAQLIGVIKMRIIGRALARIQPTTDLDTWPKLKEKLEKTFQKPLTYELAQYELTLVKQKRNETIEDFAERIQNGLEKMNKAIQNLTTDEGALHALKNTNERQALQQFEQNIFSDDLRIRVDSANKETLAKAILFAKQKEISLKLNTTKTCDFCKMTGHEISDCRKKNQQQAGTSKQGYRNTGNPNTNRYTLPNRRYDGNRYNNYNSSNYGGNYGNKPNNNQFSNPSRPNNNNNFSNNGNTNGYRYNNSARNDNYYRDNRTHNDNSNAGNIPPEQKGYFRNNNNNGNNGNNGGNNFNTNNSRNSANNTQRSPNNQNNRGSIRTLQTVNEQLNYEAIPKTVTAAQIHEKN